MADAFLNAGPSLGYSEARAGGRRQHLEDRPRSEQGCLNECVVKA